MHYPHLNSMFPFLLEDTELCSKAGLKFQLREHTNQSKFIYYSLHIIIYIYMYIYIYPYIYIYIKHIDIYSHIYIYTNLPVLPVNVIVRLPHSWNGDTKGQETVLAPSADKETCKYDTECSNSHPSLSTQKSKGLSRSKMKW